MAKSDKHVIKDGYILENIYLPQQVPTVADYNKVMRLSAANDACMILNFVLPLCLFLLKSFSMDKAWS